MKSLNSKNFLIAHLDSLLALVLGITSLILYVRTLAPSLLSGDSAEFQTIAFTLGIGHPTGYPVYILLAKLFTFLPFGDVAYCVNLLSAVAAALTVSLVYLIIRKLGARQVPAALSVFMLTFAGLFWKHASIAEIYTTSAACLAFILYSILAWKESGNPRWLFAAGFVGGLSLGIHTMVALSGLAILLFLVLSTCQRVDWTQALIGALSGLVLFILAFLFLDHYNASAGYYNASVRHALSVWKMTPSDFDSPFERLAFLYFPPQFSGQFFAVSSELILERLQDFFGNISWNAVIASIGIISLFIPRKDSTFRGREAVLLLVAFVTFIFFAASYNVDDFYVFYIPAILLLVIAIGLGFSAMADLISHLPKIQKYIPAVVVGILIIADLQFSFNNILSSWESRIPPMIDEDKARLFTAPNMRQLEAEQIIEKVEENAVIFTDWDRVYNLYYVARVLQNHIDMDFHETYPQDDVSRLAESTLAYIEANIDTRPIYFTERPTELSSRYKILSLGAGLYQITEKK